MSMNENLFIFQKQIDDFNSIKNSKSIKKNVIEKKNFDQKKSENSIKKTIQKFVMRTAKIIM